MPALPASATVSEALAWTAETLRSAGIESPEVEAEWLLSDLLCTGRAALHLSGARTLAPGQRRGLLDRVQKRQNRVPLQQVLGETEFFSLPIRITPDVLIPRPETEILVEALVARLKAHPGPRVLDLGTGSGAIAVAVARELPAAHLVATDVSAPALRVASENARLNGVVSRVSFLRADRLSAFREAPAFHAVVANPPYISSDDLPGLQPEVRDHEPRIALDGGPDGLRFYRAIAPRIHALLHPGAWIALEVGDGQAGAVSGLLSDNLALSAIQTVPDLAGIQRVVIARKP